MQSIIFVKLLTFVTLLMMVFMVTNGRPKEGRGAKGSKSRGGKKYSGKCKDKIMAEYELAFYGEWSTEAYPRMYPRYRPSAEWSKLIGKFELFCHILCFYNSQNVD